MAITNLTVFERLGDDFLVTDFTPNAGSVVPPATTDIGAGGHKAAQSRIFDIQCDVGAPADVLVINKLGYLFGKTGIEVTLTPMNALAIAALPFFQEPSAANIHVVFGAAQNGVIIRVVMDARHTIGR